MKDLQDLRRFLHYLWVCLAVGVETCAVTSQLNKRIRRYIFNQYLIYLKLIVEGTLNIDNYWATLYKSIAKANIAKELVADTLISKAEHAGGKYFELNKDTPIMLTSSNGNFSCVTGPFSGSSPVIRQFPSQRPVTRNFDVFYSVPE